jgi:OOP family OmpA-OmpF porin
VKAGLPASRFTAIGYGSTQPVADNDSDEGKARNRRIEFVVKEQP